MKTRLTWKSGVRAVLPMLLAAAFAVAPRVPGQTNAPPADGGIAPPDTGLVLLRLEERWADAVKRGDIETIDRIQAEEYEFTDPNGGIWTKARALQFIKGGMLTIEAFEMSEFKVRLYGNTAVVSLRVFWRGKSGDVDISGPQRMTDVFVQRDGRWQCVSSQATRIPTGPGQSGGAGGKS